MEVTIDKAKDFALKTDANKSHIKSEVSKCWSKIAPFWPLKSLVAVNPLYGFEDHSFEQALKEAKHHFQQDQLPKPMHAVNRETIKWLQAFFDEGQATFRMPLRDLGLFASFKQLALHDKKLHKNKKAKIDWISSLPSSSEDVILQCLDELEVPASQRGDVLTFMLTSLPGWASYVQYLVNWKNGSQSHPVSHADYLALRLVILFLLWPNAKEIYNLNQALREKDSSDDLRKILENEKAYRSQLVAKLDKPTCNEEKKLDAQFVFCIDVRSEPYRRAIEAQGNYQTFGFAGFFGIPVKIKNDLTGDCFDSCPVLIKPKHEIAQLSKCPDKSHENKHQTAETYRKTYHSLKNNFATPFVLVESLGLLSGFWMGFKSLFPLFSARVGKKLKEWVHPAWPLEDKIDSIDFEDQCLYAQKALSMMGLTSQFAPVVILCGHGSQTDNNTYASALNCGACGGQHGGGNARILASILNDTNVRKYLRGDGIAVPDDTHFVGAEHNTTTDELKLYVEDLPSGVKIKVNKLKLDLQRARTMNNRYRGQYMGLTRPTSRDHLKVLRRSHDWAQVRPEWGLAGNGSFIVGPRALTKNIDLEGKSFLHSYDYRVDQDGSLLTTILTAPMVVAQWINTQYLFSSLDNVAFGAGSKVTKNITGKIGVMQGNASDLMHGLPLQSVNKTDKEAYHLPMRLMTIVCAPRYMLDRIVKEQDVLKKLLGNGWVTLACIDSVSQETYFMNRDLNWAHELECD